MNLGLQTLDVTNQTAAVAGGGASPGAWILTTGFWDDSAVWSDADVWID